MRLIFLVFFVVLATAVFASAQTKTLDAINEQIKTLKAEKSLETVYYKESNTTKVLGFGADFGKDQDAANGLRSFNFGITFFFVGTTLTAAPDSFTTTFWAVGKKPLFAESNGLTVIVDGANLDLGNARYARKNGDPREFLNFVIPRRILEKIVKGRDAQLNIGKTQFKFTPEQVALFNNLMMISDPAQ